MDFAGRVVADLFMGGGTPLIEANRVGCDVLEFPLPFKDSLQAADRRAWSSWAGPCLLPTCDIAWPWHADCPSCRRTAGMPKRFTCRVGPRITWLAWPCRGSCHADNPFDRRHRHHERLCRNGGCPAGCSA